jgi:hypothetical protein
MASRARFQSLRADEQLEAGEIDVARNMTVGSISRARPIEMIAGFRQSDPLEQHVPTKRSVDEVAAELVPVGTIVLWFGEAGDVPDGWEIYAAAAGTFMMGADDDNAIGDSAGAGEETDATTHAARVPLPNHTHTVAEPTRTGAGVQAYRHSHRFREKTIGGLETNRLNENSALWFGVQNNQTLYKISDPTFIGFLAPSAQPSFDGSIGFPRNTEITGAAQTLLTMRPKSNSPGGAGLAASEAGAHSHTVQLAHTHATTKTGVASPTLDVQPAYRTLHYIRKVREPVFEE